MKIFLFIMLLLFSTVALADGVLRAGGDVAVFKTDAPCENAEVLSVIKPEFRGLFKAGALLTQGRVIALCWGIHESEPDWVQWADAEGDVGVLPRRAIIFDEEA